MASQKSPLWGYWVHIMPDDRYRVIRSGPGRDAHQLIVRQYLTEIGVDPDTCIRGSYGADDEKGNQRGSYSWREGERITFWYDLEWITAGRKPT
jgi:hypothetical protein